MSRRDQRLPTRELRALGSLHRIVAGVSAALTVGVLLAATTLPAAAAEAVEPTDTPDTSNSVVAQEEAPVVPEVLVPPTPHASLDKVGSDFVTINVDPAPSTIPATYNLRIERGDGINGDVNLDAPGKHSFYGLGYNREYKVSVRAFNSAGSSEWYSFSFRTMDANIYAPPAPEDLVDTTRGDVQVAAEATAGSTITVTVGKALAGQTVHGWLFSTPTDLGTADVNADGRANFIIPGNVPAGAHRLALTSADNVLVGWGDIQVAVADNGENPITPAPGTNNGTGTDTAVAAHTDADRLASTGNEFPTGLGIFGILAVIVGAGAIFLRRSAAANAA